MTLLFPDPFGPTKHKENGGCGSDGCISCDPFIWLSKAVITSVGSSISWIFINIDEIFVFTSFPFQLRPVSQMGCMTPHLVYLVRDLKHWRVNQVIRSTLKAIGNNGIHNTIRLFDIDL